MVHDENARRAHDDLFRETYAALRGLAEGYLAREPTGDTLQPTALVNELYLKLSKQRPIHFEGRSHFIAIAATAMRQLLVDRARAKRTQKRSHERADITLSIIADKRAPTFDEVIALDEALDALQRLGEGGKRQASLVELIVFVGCSLREASTKLEISYDKARKDYRFARAWLASHLSDD